MKPQIFILLIITIFTLSACKKNKLPDDVVLLPPIQGDGIQIAWTQSDDKNFNSYELYRHSSSGIDESNGELIHVSTSENENTFTDKSFNAYQQYYYRVYVVNKNGKSKGSNIESITTRNSVILLNGNFEEVTSNNPNNWTTQANTMCYDSNYIYIDSLTSSSGSNSLKFYHYTSTGCCEQWIEQNLNLADLVPNATYKLSFMHKADFTGGQVRIVLNNSSIDIEFYETVGFNGDGNWHQFTTQFQLPDDISGSNPRFIVHFCLGGPKTWWLDDVLIERI